jgi:hypothetical protein
VWCIRTSSGNSLMKAPQAEIPRAELMAMRRRLTKAEFMEATSPPWPRYGELHVGERGASLRGRIAGPSYWFERHDVGIRPNGQYWRDPDLATVHFVVDGKAAVLFYLVGRKIESCTFAYDLRPYQVTAAVSAMRRAKLRRFIRPAAEWALREMPAERRPVLAPALRRLVRPNRPKKGRIKGAA